MAEERSPPAGLLAESGDPDFLRGVAEAVLRLLMEAPMSRARSAPGTSAAPSGRPGATATATAASVRAAPPRGGAPP